MTREEACKVLGYDDRKSDRTLARMAHEHLEDQVPGRTAPDIWAAQRLYELG